MIEVLSEIESKAKLNKNNRTSLKCRSFIKKLGYRSRSKKMIHEIDQAIQRTNLTMLLPEHMESWLEIDLDDAIQFQFNAKCRILAPTSRQAPALYAFQAEAVNRIHRKMIGNDSFKGMLVLPTGGGKTTTAVRWIWEAALSKGKKVLWLAHRHELLNQALDTIENQVEKPVTYRVISGIHDHATMIQEEQLIIASKDSLTNHEERLKHWLKEDDELFLIIDEAHHATSRTYVQLIRTLEKTVDRLYLLGLTATPFRTAESESGALRKLFKDGILYKKDLKNLVASGILAEPHFFAMQTDVHIEQKLTSEQLETLRFTDQLPEKITNKLVEHHPRNLLIVQQYIASAKQFGKTILFAINQLHATMLALLFQQHQVDARAVISQNDVETNAETIRAFRNNEFPVLINVNILTEGADFPNVQSVFLTRPTISSIFMTQMVGRALRGEVAGGTRAANIVSFIDDWVDKIAWSNPQSLLAGENGDENFEGVSERKVAEIISAQAMEQLALRMNDGLDFTEMKRNYFSESVPVGVYAMHYLHEEKSVSEDVLVYENDVEAYTQMLEKLPHFCIQNGLSSKLTNGQIRQFAEQLELQFFIEDELQPMYEIIDLMAILKYYLVTKELPELLLFKERKQVNITELARTIVQKDLTYRQQKEFIQRNWDEQPFLQVFFNYEEIYYKKCIHSELLMIDTIFSPKEPYESDISLAKLKKTNHSEWRSLMYQVFERNKQKYGMYQCILSGERSLNKADFKVGYKKSLKNGGKTTVNNLALVKKSDKD